MTMRLFAISDLHADYPTNRALIDQVPSDIYQGDVLIVAGDISHDLEIVDVVLAELRRKFGAVFFVPGNHELWLRSGDSAGTSVDKFFQVIELCERLGVYTQPMKLGGFWIVPLFSWYHQNFELEAQSHRDPKDLVNIWSDYTLCQWPKGIDDIADFFLVMNTPHLRVYDAPVISFSHFLPRREFFPSRQGGRFSWLTQVVGCTAIDAQIRGVGALTHVFGHSHIPCDVMIEGVRYVQYPVDYWARQVRRARREKANYKLPTLILPQLLIENL